MAKSILIIDDERIAVEFMKNILERKGYKTFSAYNGNEALEIAKKEKPDLILLDLGMPEMDGFGVMECLGQDEEIKSIPVIMLTANTDANVIVKSLVDVGAQDYIVKPFHLIGDLGDDAGESITEDQIDRKIRRVLEKNQE